ncbi:MAG: hypothetical protein A2Y16_00475 [Tenericutes bacterium GWF2_57_13]|nr:MAG: hypothetical protein A2Y16_00475 [Tenericutes bacterium GWF2_57_13]
MLTLMNAGTYVGLAAILVLVVFAFWAIGWTRKIGRLGRAVRQAGAAVDLALTKRFAVLADLDGIVTLRTGAPAGRFAIAVKWQNGVPPQAHVVDKAAYSAEIDAYAAELIETAKADAPRFDDHAFADLLQAFEITGEQLGTARRLYNATVAAMNQTISTFPGMIVANAKRLEKQPFFEIDGSGADPDPNP